MKFLRKSGSLFLIYLLLFSVPMSVLADTKTNNDSSFSDEGRAKGGGPTIIAPDQQAREEPKEAGLASLFKALEDKDPAVREETVYLLSEFKDERVIEYLTEILLNDEDEAVRASVAEELGDLGDQRAIDPLIKALSDNNARVRESAALALGEIGGKSVIPKLMDALGDKDEDVRDAAAEALGEINERLGISESD